MTADTSVPPRNVVFDDEKAVRLSSAPVSASSWRSRSGNKAQFHVSAFMNNRLPRLEPGRHGAPGVFSSGLPTENGQKQRILSRENGKEHSFFLKATGVSLPLKKVRHLLFVFFPVQCTGHVEKSSAGEKLCPGMVENVSLRSDDFGQPFGRKAQSKLGVSCERSCAAAWNIQ